MTFTIIESYGLTAHTYTLDIEILDDLFNLGHDRYGGRAMTIDWEAMTITFK
jgi:hypothetical protein